MITHEGLLKLCLDYKAGEDMYFPPIQYNLGYFRECFKSNGGKLDISISKIIEGPSAEGHVGICKRNTLYYEYLRANSLGGGNVKKEYVRIGLRLTGIFYRDLKVISSGEKIGSIYCIEDGFIHNPIGPAIIEYNFTYNQSRGYELGDPDQPYTALYFLRDGRYMNSEEILNYYPSYYPDPANTGGRIIQYRDIYSISYIDDGQI